MNRIVKIAAPMFAAALIAGTLVGCGGQAASSSASASAASASASASATAPASPSAETQATTEETVAQLKTAMENAKDFKSVTITHNVGVEVNASRAAELASASAESASADSASADSASAAAESADSAAASDAATAEDTSFNTSTVYKFDQSGEAMKACSSSEFLGSVFNSYLDGDKAVVEVDGDAYAGTVEEMSVNEMTSVDELLKTKVGDFETIMSCVSAADVSKQGDNTVYALVIDTEKYTEADEIEKALSDAGLKKEAFTVSYEFGADGKLLSISLNEATSFETTQATLSFTDYDATVVDQAPETDKTYADMSAQIQAVVDEIASEEQEAAQAK